MGIKNQYSLAWPPLNEVRKLLILLTHGKTSLFSFSLTSLLGRVLSYPTEMSSVDIGSRVGCDACKTN
jgi:hypothetical protein